jgi:hypothetical protein
VEGVTEEGAAEGVPGAARLDQLVREPEQLPRRRVERLDLPDAFGQPVENRAPGRIGDLGRSLHLL